MSIQTCSYYLENELLEWLRNYDVLVEKEPSRLWTTYNIYAANGSKCFVFGDGIPGWDWRFDKK